MHRLLHIFSQYYFFGGEEVFFHMMTRALPSFAEVDEFVYSSREFLEEHSGAVSRVKNMLFHRAMNERLLKQAAQGYDAWIIHNVFPAMSPCIYEQAVRQSVPVIHYMHNYRQGCLNGLGFRNGRECAACSSGNYLHGILHRCWHGRVLDSMAAACILEKTRRLGTWRNLSAYIAISHRQRELLESNGVNSARIQVIPHFYESGRRVADPGDRPRRDVLFAGRLTEEKGVFRLLQAWERLKPERRSLIIMGEGPLYGKLKGYIDSRGLDSVKMTGFVNREDQEAFRSRCGIKIVPSLWEEPFGLAVLESWEYGAPVLVTPAGGLPELVSHGRDGWVAESSSLEGLAQMLCEALHVEDQWTAMGKKGKEKLNERFTVDVWKKRMRRLFVEMGIE